MRSRNRRPSDQVQNTEVSKVTTATVAAPTPLTIAASRQRAFDRPSATAVPDRGGPNLSPIGSSIPSNGGNGSTSDRVSGCSGLGIWVGSGASIGRRPSRVGESARARSVAMARSVAIAASGAATATSPATRCSIGGGSNDAGDGIQVIRVAELGADHIAAVTRATGKPTGAAHGSRTSSVGLGAAQESSRDRRAGAANRAPTGMGRRSATAFMRKPVSQISEALRWIPAPRPTK